MLHNLNTLAVGQELEHDGHGVGLVVYDALDAGLDQVFCTHEAWERGDVAGAAIGFGPSSLDDSVLLRVNTDAFI